MVNTDDASDPDAELAERLRGALRDEAESIVPPAAAWTRFAERVGVVGDDGSEPDRKAEVLSPAAAVDPAEPRVADVLVAVAGSRERPVPRRFRRLPLIAAAAVVIAAGTVGTVTYLVGHGAGTSANPGISCGAAAITVPIDTSGGMLSLPAGGSVGQVGTGEPTTSTVGSAGTPGTATSGGGSTGSVEVSLADGGVPPDVALCVSAPPSNGFELLNPDDAGYLGVVETADGRALVGAVGPDVEQVQVLGARGASSTGDSAAGTPSPTPADIDPGFSATAATWIIDGGRGTAWSLPDSGTTVWTALSAGWHAFALAMPASLASAEVIQLDAHGLPTTSRVVRLPGGQVDIGTTPGVTTTFQTTAVAPSRPPAGYSSATVSPAETTDPAKVSADCAGLADGVSIADGGFNLGTATFAADAGGGLCFRPSERGAGAYTWAYAPARPGALRNLGITGPGPFADQVTGAMSSERLVWGAVDDTVASVRVDGADGQTADQAGDLISLPNGGRAFLIRVPATGSVTVTAVGSSGAALDTVTLP